MSTRTWNPRTHEDYDTLKGKDVFTSDDEKVGTVKEVLHPANESTEPEQHFFLVKPGMLDKLTGEDEVYVRATEVEFFSDDRIVLGTSKDRIDVKNWAAPRDVNSFRRR